MSERASLCDHAPRACSVAVCDRPAKIKGLCSGHYYRLRRLGDPGDSPIAERTKNKGRFCAIEGCDRSARVRGWCYGHYWRWKRYGDPLSGRTPPEHGTYTMYHNHGCRCDACRQANTDWHREKWHKRGRTPMAVVIARRHAEAEARDNHGTETRYALGCRCDACRTAASTMRRIRRQRATAA